MDILPSGELVFDTDINGGDAQILLALKGLLYGALSLGRIRSMQRDLKLNATMNSDKLTDDPTPIYEHLSDTLEEAGQQHLQQLGVDRPATLRASVVSATYGGTLVVLDPGYTAAVLIAADGLALQKDHIKEREFTSLLIEDPSEFSAEVATTEIEAAGVDVSEVAASKVIDFYGIQSDHTLS